MNELTFCYFMDYPEGTLARMETTGPYEIPLNIHIDNAEEFSDLSEGPCSVDLYGVGHDIDIFISEEAYRATKPFMDSISMIPVGTFPPDAPFESFEQSSQILFTGRVLDAAWDTEAEQDAPNCCLTVETLELFFNLYLRTDVPVEEGYLVHGMAWLYGDIVMEDAL